MTTATIEADHLGPVELPSSVPAAADPPEQAAPPQVVGAPLSSVWRRLVLFAAGLALILGGIETSLYLADSTLTPPLEDVSRHPAPYVEFYQQPNFDRNGIVTNEAGFRYGPLPRAKPPGETRVFFFGTSVGFNGVTNEATISGYMERMLGAMPEYTGRRIRVVNASGVSFSTGQSLALLVTRVLEYAPDLVIVFHGPEALFFPVSFESRPGYPFNFMVREDLHASLTGEAVQPDPLISLLMRTRTMQFFQPDLQRRAVQSELFRRNNATTISSLEQYDPYIDAVISDVSKMVRIGGAYGARTLVAVPPARAGSILPGGLDRLGSRLEDAVNSQPGNSVRYVDTLSLGVELDDRRLWWSDGIHWTDEGNLLIAECLVHSIVESGQLDRSLLAAGRRASE